MSVVNLAPDATLLVRPGQIRGSCYVYRMAGYDKPGDVAWAPADGPVVFEPIAPGETVRLPIDGQGGEIANLTAATLQVLWANEAATTVQPKPARSVRQRLQRRAERRTGAGSAKARATDPLQQAMQTLNAQWYNAVVSGCGLDPATFQLTQGSSPLGTTSEILWEIFDATPPLSISNYYNPSQFNSFSADYGAVINNLIPQNSNKFQIDMGDYYSQWVAYLKTSPTVPNPGGMPQLFQNWAQYNMPPNQAQVCYTDYQQISQGIVPVAVQMWLNAGGSIGGTKAYNKTIGMVNIALQGSPSKAFQMDSQTQSSDISHTWADAQAGFLFDIFEIGGDGHYDQISTTLASCGLNFDVSFNNVLTIAAGPLATTSSDPILSQYQPWYDSAALNLAYQNNNNSVWNRTPPTWDNTFGPNGNMLRTASALVIVDGITITTTSIASISTSDQTQVNSAIEGGIFPFFEASGEGGWTHQVDYDSSGMMTISSSCPTGNPQVLGVIVTPISGVLAL